MPLSIQPTAPKPVSSNAGSGTPHSRPCSRVSCESSASDVMSLLDTPVPWTTIRTKQRIFRLNGFRASFHLCWLQRLPSALHRESPTGVRPRTCTYSVTWSAVDRGLGADALFFIWKLALLNCKRRWATTARPS